MARIKLDAAEWRTPEDFYAALLPALGAPEWHGRNLDAIYDSIFGGGINRIEEFHLLIKGVDALDADMRAFLGEVQAVFADGREMAGATLSFEPAL